MKPATEAELSDYVAQADGPLLVRGGGTQGIEGQGDSLDTTGLSGVKIYEPGALTMVVQAGTALHEIETILARENQRLPFEPVDYRGLLKKQGNPTIGGVVAGNNSGPRRIQVGAARDFTLGVRFVDGSGRVIKNGGRVMKNVTGYDLVKLMAGSWGTLGVLSEVSLKVLPMPEAETTLMLQGVDIETAVALMAKALGSPFDVSAAAYVMGAQCALIRIEGFEKSVAYRSRQLQEMLSDLCAQITLAENPAGIWADVRDVKRFHDAEGDVWRVSVKPSDGPRVVAQAGALDAQLDWAGGLVWLLMPKGTDLRARLTGIAGHATLIRGEGQPRFHPEPAGVAALSAGLRKQFDPKGILNPGLMDAR